MKNKILNQFSKSFLTVLCSAFCITAFTSCSDDGYDKVGSDSSAITVDGIYLWDVNQEEEEDQIRPLEYVRPGFYINIKGSGFGRLQKLYINGYDTYFNPTYVTDTDILVRVNKDTPITDVDPDVLNTIVFVKKKASYTYEFEVKPPLPSIDAVSHTMAQAGEKILLSGSFLFDATGILFPDGNGNSTIPGTDITSDDEKGLWAMVTVPAGVGTGAILFEGRSGKAYSSSFFNFHAGVTNNFDDRNYYGWTDGSGSPDNVNSVVPASGVWPKSQGNYRTTNAAWDTTGIPADVPADNSVRLLSNSSYWDGILSNAFDYTTPATDIAFQFDMYVPEDYPWNSGFLNVILLDELGSGWEYKLAPWAVERNGNYMKSEYYTNGWVTVSVPLSTFTGVGNSGTLQDVIDEESARQHHQYGIQFNNAEYEGIAATTGKYVIAVDNFRFVPLTKPAITDQI